MDKIALKMISEMLDSLEIKSAILLITVGTILTILALNQIVFRLRYRLPPGPLSLPFVGHLPFLGADRHLYFDALRKKYGNVFSLYLGTRFTVVVCDFESIKDIAHKDTFTGRPPNIFEFNKKNPHFGEMSGSDWKEQRRFMMFTLKELGMGKTSGENAITNQVSNFLNTLSEESDGRDINIRDALIPVTNNIIFSMIADKQFNLEDKMSEIVKGFQSKAMEFLELRMKQFYYPFLRQILSISNRKIKQGVEVISKFEHHLEKEVDLHEQSYEQGCKRDFIDYYLEEIKKKELKTFTRETLIGNSSILMLIGAETIQVTLELFFMNMATFTDAQEKAHKEIINVVGTHRLPSWSDRNDLPYTMALLTEVFRFSDIFTVNDPRCLYLGSRLTIVVTDFNVIKEISFNDNFSGRVEHAFELIPGQPNMGEMNGSDWKDQRRFMLHSFRELGMGRTQGAVTTQDHVARFTKTLRDQDRKPVRLRDVLVHEANNIIFQMMANATVDPNSKMSTIVQNFQSSMQSYLHENKKKYYYPLFGKFLTLFNSEIRNGIKAISALKLEVEKELEKHEKEYQEGYNKDFMDFYLQEMIQNPSKSFTKKSLVANSTALIAAGAEATQISLEWIFQNLVLYPEVQEKMHKEVVATVGKDRLPEWNDKHELPYTQAVFYEVLRHQNMMPVNEERQIMEDDKIGGYDAPKGAAVIMVYWSVNADKKIWGDPEVFRPERFISKDGKRLNEMVDYIVAFSLGKRSCPGEGIAKMNILLYMSAVSQKFQILPPKEGLNTKVISALGIRLENARFVFKLRE